MPNTTALLVLAVSLLWSAAAWLSWQRPVDARHMDRRPTGFRIPINQADTHTLCLLPGIGPNLAARIVAHRRRHGPFTAPDQLQHVSGIGIKTQHRLAPLIRLAPDPQRHPRDDHP